MRIFTAFLLGASCLILAGAAQAQDRDPCGAGLVCASNPATVMQAMEKAGFEPKMTKDDSGDPMIESDEAAYHFDVYFYGCEKGKNCDSLRFEVLFKEEDDNTLELANGWNKKKRFLQASIKDGRFVAAYDLATIGGVNQRNFADVLDWWKSMLGDLATYFKETLPTPVVTPPVPPKPRK
jgi:hypothetical protein